MLPDFRIQMTFINLWQWQDFIACELLIHKETQKQGESDEYVLHIFMYI